LLLCSHRNTLLFWYHNSRIFLRNAIVHESVTSDNHQCEN